MCLGVLGSTSFPDFFAKHRKNVEKCVDNQFKIDVEWFEIGKLTLEIELEDGSYRLTKRGVLRTELRPVLGTWKFSIFQ